MNNFEIQYSIMIANAMLFDVILFSIFLFSDKNSRLHNTVKMCFFTLSGVILLSSTIVVGIKLYVG